MVRGLYSGALGMMTQMQRMDVISNNLANADTTSFKRDHVVSHSFSEQFLYRINDPGIRMFNPKVGRVNPGVFVDDVFTVFTQGPLRETHNSFDFALSGQGFFVIDVNGHELYTRDGNFTISNGMLMTAAGGRVQGIDGDIILPNGDTKVNEQGEILVNNEVIATLRLVNFSDLHSLRKMQDNLYFTTEGSEEIPADAQVLQGFIESSNIDVVREMVEMINISRAFETNSRMVTIIDQTLQNAVSDIARR